MSLALSPRSPQDRGVDRCPEVVEGTLDAVLGVERVTVGPGDTILAPGRSDCRAKLGRPRCSTAGTVLAGDAGA